jgi:xanthine/CO dehydrogenase XdhC/CoxF family maturation factor
MRELQAITRQLCASTSASVLATLVSVEGSSYRRPGARMLVAAGGGRTGAISGGCLEEDLVEHARRVAASGRPELVLYDTTAENDLVWGVGLGCHGIVRVLLERLPPRPAWASAVAENMGAGRPTRLEVVWQGPPESLGTRLLEGGGPGEAAAQGVLRDTVEAPNALVIFGAGDDARPLCGMAAGLGWSVAVADPRGAMATRERFPGACGLVVAPAGELVARTAPRPGSLAVVMTHRFRDDVPLIRGLLPLPLAYLGLLGPRARAERILGELARDGMAVTDRMRGVLHAPVGLDLGSEGPEAVALSILAEISAVLAGRDARPLRERTLPIHA